MPEYRFRQGSLQEEFFASRNKIQIYGGGYGNGKTSAACIKAYHMAKLYPGSNGLIARSTYPVLNDTIRKEFFKWCPPEDVKRMPNDKDNTCYFHNGTTINFRFLAQRGRGAGGDTTSNVLSATYDWIVVDQVEDPEIVYKDFIDLNGRLRGTAALDRSLLEGIPAPLRDGWPDSGPRMMILTTNPTRNWVYRMLVKPMHLYLRSGLKTPDLIVNSRTGEPMIDLFEGSTYANQENLPEDFIIGQESTLKGQSRDRYLMGEWAAYEGLVYPQFDYNVHMIPHAHLEEYYKYCWPLGIAVREGYDFGIAVPSCYLYQFIDPFGNILFLNGFHEKELHVSEQAARIKDIRHTYEWDRFNRDPMFVDPSIMRRTGAGKPVGRMFQEDFDIDVQRGDNDILSGIARVEALMNVNKFHKHPLYHTYNSPHMYFSDDLSFVMDEITDYFWHKDTAGAVEDKPVDKNDHAMDVLRYSTTRLVDVNRVDRIQIISESNIPMTWREYTGQEQSNRRYRYG